MEKVGQLRQSSTPEAGKVYWMAFSNKDGRVKRGDRKVSRGQFGRGMTQHSEAVFLEDCELTLGGVVQ
jgi:hypothetical protein